MSIFSKVGGLKPGLTAFNLSHTNLFDCNFGQLIPVACLETLPGDVFKLDADVVGRLTSALKSPILSEMDIVLEAFYTPTRLLMGRDANFPTPVGEVSFEEFLSGGKDGSHIGSNSYPLPVLKGSASHAFIEKFSTCSVGDYLGIQTNTEIGYSSLPVAFPWRAYRWIWNEFYRDENLQGELQVSQFIGSGEASDSSFVPFSDYDSVLYRCWRKDYFTSALPFQQRGTSPALPISGFLPVVESSSSNKSLWGSIDLSSTSGFDPNVSITLGNPTFDGNATTSWPVTGTSFGDESNKKNISLEYARLDPVHISGFGVNLSDAATFDVNQIRTAFQVQKWLERNARGGVRYTEYLRSHFGIAPSDARLQRPQFIGSIKSPWIVSEVLQTSETNSSVTPQGNQAGQAINLSRGRLGNFRSYEYGYIMILCSVVPKALYQQGIPRWMSRKTNLDFYSPEFAHLSEQAIKNKEIFFSNNPSVDDATFGFQPIWNELRFIPSRVSGHLRTGADGYSFDYWHFGRSFSNTPSLDDTFLSIGKSQSSKSELMRVFAVQDENPFIINVGLRIKALRPMPYLSEPGLIDHF